MFRKKGEEAPQKHVCPVEASVIRGESKAASTWQAFTSTVKCSLHGNKDNVLESILLEKSIRLPFILLNHLYRTFFLKLCT